MKIGDRVQTKAAWSGGPAAFTGTVDKVHATGPNPLKPECKIRVELDEPYFAGGTHFEWLTFNPADLEVIEAS